VGARIVSYSSIYENALLKIAQGLISLQAVIDIDSRCIHGIDFESCNYLW